METVIFCAAALVVGFALGEASNLTLLFFLRKQGKRDETAQAVQQQGKAAEEDESFRRAFGLSIDEQYANLFGYDGKPQKKGE